MEIKNYSLKIGNKNLLEDVSVTFYKGRINHILGKNGVGKSQFAKDYILDTSGCIDKDIRDNTILISSASNVPTDITKKFLLQILSQKFYKEEIMKLSKLLNLDNIDDNTLIKKLSDGQKQKLKLLSFLLKDTDIIILDEITNALDQNTVNEIHNFLKVFIKENPGKTIINITHNLADLKVLQGEYFIIKNQNIMQYKNINSVLKEYLEVS